MAEQKIPWQQTPEGREKMRQVMKDRWARKDPTLHGARKKVRRKPRGERAAVRKQTKRAIAPPSRRPSARELRALARGPLPAIIRNDPTLRAVMHTAITTYLGKRVEALITECAEAGGIDPRQLRRQLSGQLRRGRN